MSDTLNFSTFTLKGSNDFIPTSRPRHYRVPDGTQITWSGSAVARKNHTADGSFPIQIGGHTLIADESSPVTLNVGDPSSDWCVFATPNPDPSDICRLEEAVLVECGDIETVSHPTFPAVITGATIADGQVYLDNSHFWIETKRGWQGRRGHAILQQGDDGYGAWMAMHTSLALLLLVSDIPDIAKEVISERLFQHARDLHKWGIGYGADGGHGLGRWQLARYGELCGLPALNPSEDYSELTQTYEISEISGLSAPSGISNYPDPDWRMRVNEEAICQWNGVTAPPPSIPSGQSRSPLYRWTAAGNCWAGALALEQLGYTFDSDEQNHLDYVKWHYKTFLPNVRGLLGNQYGWTWALESRTLRILNDDTNLTALGVLP